MVDRDKLLSVLRKRFPEASQQQAAWAANAIVGLDDEWEELAWDDPEMACSGPIPTGEQRFLMDELRRGTEFQIFRRRRSDVRQ